MTRIGSGQLVNYFLGDLPARQFEAGNSIGGIYPCMCGVNINNITTVHNFLKTGPYQSMDSRVEMAKKSPSIKELKKIDVNTMKV